MSHRLVWHVLCRVVDNYGDAGVCWRLAHQLASEHDLDVTLWIDRIDTLARLQPEINVSVGHQDVCGVHLRHLTPEIAAPACWPDIIIDAFGGGLPENWLEALHHDFPITPSAEPKHHAPRWIVLEYLSAEAWVDGMHGMPSPPSDIVVPRHFFFPGFTGKSGGLLREKHLLEERDIFQRSPEAQQTFLAGLNVTVPDNALLVSLFCYDTPLLPALLDAWANSRQPVICLMPEGMAPDALRRWRQQHHLPPHARNVSLGALTLHSYPFLPQPDFDRLLWCCDLNFVRGEDSFVRAQWAAKPFIWQAYRQEDAAHLPKLEAFLDRYCAGATASDDAGMLTAFWRAWNQSPGAPPIQQSWAALAAALFSFSASPAAVPSGQGNLQALARQWATMLSQYPSLATQLIRLTR